MVSFYGDYDLTETVNIPFNTFSSDDPSASVTVTNLVAGDVYVHQDGVEGTPTGITVSLNVGTVNGNHLAILDLTDTNDAGFYAVGSRYQVRMEGVTIDGATVNAWIGTFSIGCTLRPTTAGRTLNVNASNAGDANAVSAVAAFFQDCFTVDSGEVSGAEVSGSLILEVVKAVWDRILTGATHNIASSGGRRMRQLAVGVISTTWYVDGVSGDDGNDGDSPDDPFATIGAAFGVVSSGEAIEVGPATYTETALDLDTANVVMYMARGAIITGGGTGTCLVISASNCTVSGGMLLPGATEIGVDIESTADHTTLEHMHGSICTITFDINAPMCRLIDCESYGHTTTGFDISAAHNLFHECVSEGSGAVRGFYLSTNGADGNAFFNCVSQRNTTAGWEVVSGADNNSFIWCGAGVNDGARTDNGTNNGWPGYATLPIIVVTPDAAGVVATALGTLETHGDSTWATATGFSTHTAANVYTAFGDGSNLTTCATATNVTVSNKTGFSLVSTGLDLVTAWTTNITGNLSGSVGSVTGAVGSVSGAVTTDAASRTASKADVSGLATSSALSTHDGKLDTVDTNVDTIITTGSTGPWTTGAGGQIGSGAIEWTIAVQDTDSNPLDGVEVWVTTDSAGNNVVAGTLSTSTSGEVTFMLDAGTYYVWRQLAGYNFTNPQTIVVS